MINYFNFKKFNNQFLLTNDFGRYIFLEKDEFKQFLSTSHVNEETIENRLKKNGFIYDDKLSFSDEFRYSMVNSKSFLFSPTQLHIFVVTSACNLNCIYCQAHMKNSKNSTFMNKETAKSAVDFALESPTKDMTFEFQGGEPLLNFEIIKFIIEYAEANKKDKNIQYSIVSNLILLKDDMIDFFEKYSVNISTSLDGDETIHNINRPYKTGEPSFSDVMDSIKRLKQRGLYVGALMTTTRQSLSRSKEIIDTYVKLGFTSISIRPLTPLGCAKDNWSEIGYSADEFIKFYKECLNYLINYNKNNVFIRESIASVFLKKIIEGIAVNYMELRSPCGATLGQIAYFTNGKIYTCDEGRMLSEMGDDAFLLGDVATDNYQNIIDTKTCNSVCHSSILESLASCSDCVYQQYCGVCPIINYALYGDIFEKNPNNYRCMINCGILDFLFGILQEDEYEIRQIFRRWIN